jgi:tankyrase
MIWNDHPGSGSRIRILIFYSSRIPDPVVKKAPDPGSATQKITFLCAGYGRKEAVEILLNAGANVHARDDGGLIPLHNACSFGHAEVRHFSP